VTLYVAFKCGEKHQRIVLMEVWFPESVLSVFMRLEDHLHHTVIILASLILYYSSCCSLILQFIYLPVSF